MNKPNINVTPLIDVLLVLLIIFMIVSPLKPANFEAKIPQEPGNTDASKPNDHALVVSVEANLSLRLNNEADLGTAEETEKLIERLQRVFRERRDNNVLAESSSWKTDSQDFEKIEKTVFIKATRETDYGSVVKVIDAVKLSGADPISLQIDDLR